MELASRFQEDFGRKPLNPDELQKYATLVESLSGNKEAIRHESDSSLNLGCHEIFEQLDTLRAEWQYHIRSYAVAFNVSLFGFFVYSILLVAHAPTFFQYLYFALLILCLFSIFSRVPRASRNYAYNIKKYGYSFMYINPFSVFKAQRLVGRL